LRLRDAHFRSGDFGSIATDEVIHGLRRRELAHGRQHAEGVAREKNDIGRMASDAGNLGVADKLDRIALCVLRDRRRGNRPRAHGDRTHFPRRAEPQGLKISGSVSGVRSPALAATAFDVEDPLSVQQARRRRWQPLGIGRQCRFALPDASNKAKIGPLLSAVASAASKEFPAWDQNSSSSHYALSFRWRLFPE
jgi:hypothetical protein